MPKTDSIAQSHAAGQDRAQHRFHECQSWHFQRVDRLFAGLLVFQWLACICAALWISPLAWAGSTSDVHLHVWAALLLGGAIISLPLGMVLFQPGRAITRHLVGVAQMLLGALLIHLTGGRIETHFHVFGSLAFLAFYRDWRVIVSSSAVVAIDHFVRGLYWPESAYGVLVSSHWRWLEHTGWVVFEDIFLIVACLRGVWEVRMLTETQAHLEDARERIEDKVRARTVALESLTNVYKVTLEKARASEAKYRHTLNAAADAIISLDEQGNVLEFNRAAEALFGYQRHEMLGRPPTAIMPERRRALHENGVRRFLETGLRKLPNWNSLLVTGLTKDGHEVPLEISLSVLQVDGKKYLTGVCRDITERKQVEQTMKERAKIAALTGEIGVALVKQRSLQAMLQHCAEILVDHLNIALARIWQLNESEQMLELRASAGIYTHLDGLHARIPVGKFRIGLIAQERQPHLTNDVSNDPHVGDPQWAGHEGLVAFAGHPLLVGNRLVGVMGMFVSHPLSENTIKALAAIADHIALGIDRKLAETEKEQIYEENQRLLASIPSLLIGFDSDCRITKWNRAAEEILGVPMSKAIRARLEELEISWDHAQLDKIVRDCLSTKRSISPSKYIPFRRRDGANGSLGVSVSPTIKNDNEVKGVILLATDLTERRNLEAQLAHAQKLESIGQLAAGIAHEINTPTQYVGDNIAFFSDAFKDIRKVVDRFRGALNAVKDGILDEQVIAEIEEEIDGADFDYLADEIPKAIAQAQEGIERITKIVRAMKEFSHPGGEDKVASDINKLIQNTITVARNEWKYVAEVVMDFDIELPLVPVHIGEFNQVILNLIVNAAHAIGDCIKDDPSRKGLLTISTRGKKDCVEIRVQDTGTGIPEAIRAKIFEPFFTTKPMGKGTGQGLAIAHAAIVKKHGGTLTFETEVGKGTTFIIRLPLPASTASIHDQLSSEYLLASSTANPLYPATRAGALA